MKLSFSFLPVCLPSHLRRERVSNPSFVFSSSLDKSRIICFALNEGFTRKHMHQIHEQDIYAKMPIGYLRQNAYYLGSRLCVLINFRVLICNFVVNGLIHDNLRRRHKTQSHFLFCPILNSSYQSNLDTELFLNVKHHVMPRPFLDLNSRTFCVHFRL
jgi:hypothetical protein